MLAVPGVRAHSKLKQESGTSLKLTCFSGLSKLFFQVSPLLTPVLCHIIAFCESSAHSTYILKSVLDSNRFILQYSEQIKKKMPHFLTARAVHILAQAFLTPNILLLSLHTLLDNIQIYVIFFLSCEYDDNS